ncbi:coat protein [Black grass cryptic virus 2]|nr:coat protein [Black grass cryptic virus 2]CEK42601.1 coat protein [Black grass cryptic virus 2]
MSTSEGNLRNDPNRIPEPIPMDIDQLGHSATDVFDPTHFDPEGVKPLVQDPVAPKKRGKTHPRSLDKQVVENSTPVNDLRRVSASLAPSESRFPDPNMFIPNFVILFHNLATMNNKVCTMRPFGESGTVNNWIPQVSNIVFAVLAIVQVLRAQQLAGLLTPSQNRFLKSFIGKHPLETIIIPGPLLPFFRSISSANPGFGNFGDVTPVIPPFTQNEERLYNIDYIPPSKEHVFQGITMMLPNIPLMMDQLVALVKHVLTLENNIPKKYSTFTQLQTIFGMNKPEEQAPRHSAFVRLQKSIGFWQRPTASDGLIQRFANYIDDACPDFPAPPKYVSTHAGTPADPTQDPPIPEVPATWTALDDFAQFMCMEETSVWFSKFLEGMHVFNKQWKDNERLSNIHPTKSAAGLITFYDAEYTAIPTESQFRDRSFNNATHQLVMNTRATTACPHIIPDDAIDAQSSQLNAACARVFNNAMTIGAPDVTRFGYYWVAKPTTFQTNNGNLPDMFPNVISSPDYFADA